MIIQILSVIFTVLLLAVPAFAQSEKSEVVAVPTTDEVATSSDLAQKLVKIFCEEGIDDGDRHLFMPDGSCPAVGGP